MSLLGKIIGLFLTNEEIGFQLHFMDLHIRYNQIEREIAELEQHKLMLESGDETGLDTISIFLKGLIESSKVEGDEIQHEILRCHDAICNLTDDLFTVTNEKEYARRQLKAFFIPVPTEKDIAQYEAELMGPKRVVKR